MLLRLFILPAYHYQTETRKLRFKPCSYEIDHLISSYDLQPIYSIDELANRTKYGSILTEALVTPSIRRDIAVTLHKAGLPVNFINPECEDVLKRKITIYGTVRGPYHTNYLWTSILSRQRSHAPPKICRLLRRFVKSSPKTTSLK